MAPCIGCGKRTLSNVLFGKTPYLRQGSSRFFFGLPNVLAQCAIPKISGKQALSI